MSEELLLGGPAFNSSNMCCPDHTMVKAALRNHEWLQAVCILTGQLCANYSLGHTGFKLKRCKRHVERANYQSLLETLEIKKFPKELKGCILFESWVFLQNSNTIGKADAILTSQDTHLVSLWVVTVGVGDH